MVALLVQLCLGSSRDGRPARPQLGQGSPGEGQLLDVCPDLTSCTGVWCSPLPQT